MHSYWLFLCQFLAGYHSTFVFSKCKPWGPVRTSWVYSILCERLFALNVNFFLSNCSLFTILCLWCPYVSRSYKPVQLALIREDLWWKPWRHITPISCYLTSYLGYSFWFLKERSRYSVRCSTLQYNFPARPRRRRRIRHVWSDRGM